METDPSSVDTTMVPNLDEQRLIREGLPLLDKVARTLHRQFAGRIELDDLRSMGQVSLVTLVRQFDPDRAPFEPFLRQRLRWALLDGIRRQTHSRSLTARAAAISASDRVAERVEDEEGPPTRAQLPTEGEFRQKLRSALHEHAAAMGIALLVTKVGTQATTGSERNPEKATMRARLATLIRTEVDGLDDERARELVSRHYFGGERFDDIAESLGISKSWASRIHAQALSVLSKRLRERGMVPPKGASGPA